MIQSSKQISLTEGYGKKTIKVKFRDQHATPNVSPEYSTEIYYTSSSSPVIEEDVYLYGWLTIDKDGTNSEQILWNDDGTLSFTNGTEPRFEFNYTLRVPEISINELKSESSGLTLQGSVSQSGSGGGNIIFQGGQ